MNLNNQLNYDYRSIVHLDMKPENILLKSKKSYSIKIADFGLAKQLKSDEESRIMVGTAEFVSPEIINYDPVSTASDMWSVGVICYLLLTGLSPSVPQSHSPNTQLVPGASVKGGQGGQLPPYFGRIEGTAGQQQRAALLLAPYF